MSDPARRRELRDDHRQRPRTAAVYLLRVGGEVVHMGTTTDLDALRNRLDFARITGTPGALDLRLRDVITRHGIGALRLDIIDTLAIEPPTTPDEAASDLSALEQLWRERLGVS